MKTRLLIFSLLAALSLLVASHASGAALAHPIRLAIEVFGNAIERSRGPRCAASQVIDKGGRVEWWVAIGQAKPEPQTGWQAAGSEIRCGAGALQERKPGSTGSPESAYVVATMSMFAWPAPAAPLTAERVLSVEVSLAVRKLAGFGTQGEPKHEQLAGKRTFYFPNGGSAFVPLIISSEKEKREFGWQEVLLRIEARPVPVSEDEGAASYGTVSVTSDADGAELLLDGGVVGKISARKETILGNLVAGEREVRVQDSSGREIRRLVRVEKNRKVLVGLNLAGPDPNAVPYRLVPLGKNRQGYEEYRRERDEAVVVRIPAGEFLMGNKNTERQPLEHRVSVSEFLMDKTAVTWGQYSRFAQATETPLPPHEPYWGIRPDHPAVFVTWEEGQAYCEWVGGRLPTEAEREKAARGTDDRKYPWGNEEPNPDLAVFRRTWGLIATDPVGAHPKGASPYGLMDMGGNVWEWCSDWYDDKYYEVSPARDPKGPPTGIARVVRGGSWDSRPDVTSASCRNWGHRGYREGDFGFRCAMNVPKY